MNWMDWVIVGVLALNALTCVLTIGKPRKPLDPGTVGWILIINALLIVGLIVTH